MTKKRLEIGDLTFEPEGAHTRGRLDNTFGDGIETNVWLRNDTWNGLEPGVHISVYGPGLRMDLVIPVDLINRFCTKSEESQ